MIDTQVELSDKRIARLENKLTKKQKVKYLKEIDSITIRPSSGNIACSIMGVAHYNMQLEAIIKKYESIVK